MTPQTDAPRLQNLIVARESDTDDLPLLEGMILQTLERLPDLPGRDRLRELGTRPVKHPEEVGGQRLKRLGSKAVFFAVEGTACLYSQGSAAKDETQRRENGFVELLCKIILKHRPHNIYVATFSRLVRSMYHSAPVRAALEEAQSTLHYDGGTINFTEDGEAELKWAVMSAFADMERRAVVTRLMLGRCARHRRGEWVYGPMSVPMGYTLVQGRLQVHAEAKDAVHKAIRLMGDPAVTNREIVTALGDIGVLPPQSMSQPSWTYSQWEWDGTPYVPESRRANRSNRGSPSHTEANSNDHDSHAPGEGHPSPGDADDEIAEQTAAHADPDDDDGDHDDADASGREVGDGDDEAEDDDAIDDSDDSEDPDDVDSEVLPAPRRRARPTHVGEYAQHAQVAKRIIRTLDLWQSGRIIIRHASSLRHVSQFAEYAVQVGPDGARYVEFDYEPGVVPGGWASGEEFARARAVREQRALVDSQHAHALGHQLPLLGNLGRWNQNGYRYGLLSIRNGAGDTRGYRYELRRMRLPTDLQTNRDGQIRYPGFVFQGRRMGEQLAAVDAVELHQAISTALVSAITEGAQLKPHEHWPPTELCDPAADQVAALEEESRRLHAMAERARREHYSAGEDVSASLRQRFLEDAAAMLAEAEDVDAQLDAARQPFRLPDRLAARPERLAHVLAGLGTVSGPVPREVTVAVNEVLGDLRLKPVGRHVEGTICAHIPVDDGLVTVGPVAFTVRQRAPMGSRRSASVRRATREVTGAHVHAAAEALLTTDQPITALGDSLTRTGARQRDRVIDHLVELGLKRSSAGVILDCAVLVTRQSVWAHLTETDQPTTISDGFAERVRDTYLQNPRNLRIWHRRTALPGPFTDFLRANGGEAPMTAVKAWVRGRGHRDDQLQWLFYPPGQGSIGDREMWATAIRPSRPEGSRYCTPECRRPCWAHNLARLRPCPHCHALLDHHVPVPEIPTAMLCGACLREPTTDSPVFPREYLDVDVEAAEARSAASNPISAQAREASFNARSLRRNARRWAVSTGRIAQDHTGGIGDDLFVEYLEEVAGGEVTDHSSVRRWARDRGLTTATRGGVTDNLVTEYRRDIAERKPELVERWAQTHHVPPGVDVIDAFAQHRPATTI